MPTRPSCSDLGDIFPTRQRNSATRNSARPSTGHWSSAQPSCLTPRRAATKTGRGENRRDAKGAEQRSRNLRRTGVSPVSIISQPGRRVACPTFPKIRRRPRTTLAVAAQRGGAKTKGMPDGAQRWQVKDKSIFHLTFLCQRSPNPIAPRRSAQRHILSVREDLETMQCREAGFASSVLFAVRSSNRRGAKNAEISERDFFSASFASLRFDWLCVLVSAPPLCVLAVELTAW
jgi:hypothetical protein